ncbi:hypothetical protein HPB50_022923 [Hyalomma asiaticum]|uniref:Uncharacterized protein n=1 Tax=Hyalomma asiaticum TaxID=266040 RepID=A0ACB7T999_HYAAI|nr:hypothetical protein HPB50_022923 [Hyalomma asiaticum]
MARSRQLATSLDTYCTHVIYTGTAGHRRSQPSGKVQVQVLDVDMSRLLSVLNVYVCRVLIIYVTSWRVIRVHEPLADGGHVGWRISDRDGYPGLQRAQQEPRAVPVVSMGRRQLERGRRPAGRWWRTYITRGCAASRWSMASHMHRTRFIRFCQNYVHKMKNNESLIIRVQRTVELTKGLFERLASIPLFLVLEAQVTQMPDEKTKRYPNPYQPFTGSHNKDVYMRYRLWRVHPWRRQLRLNNVCFTLSMTVIKAQKGATRNSMLAYSYTGLKEPCQQTSMETGVDWKALSRFRENRTVFYAYDNKQTITNKLWRLAHEFPRYCVALYDVERDDYEDVCPRKSVPLLRVVRKLVTATAQSRVV